MATLEQAQQALLDAIVAHAGAGSSGGAASAKQLAEAYAWLKFPNQPHGA